MADTETGTLETTIREQREKWRADLQDALTATCIEIDKAHVALAELRTKRDGYKRLLAELEPRKVREKGAPVEGLPTIEDDTPGEAVSDDE